MAAKIIISGIPPGPSGVGRVVEYLINNSKGVKFLYPPRGRTKSIKSNLLNLKLLGLVLSVIENLTYIYQKFFYDLNIRFIQKKKIVLIHPQSLGFDNVIKLIERNNSSLYIMDNSFFCIKSYNYLDQTQEACFLCLGGNFHNAQNNNCSAFPLPYSYEDYFEFILHLKENYKKIRFIIQNNGQLNLLKSQFGSDLNYSIVGLLTSDLFEKELNVFDKGNVIYDFVFHGDHTLPKGSGYVLKLASYLPNYTFLFPFSKPIDAVNLRNVRFQTMNWSNGLKDAVVSSKLTFAPSIWAAPIEGSVMKTLKLGVALAVYDVQESFAREIPDNAVVKLTGNIEEDVALINSFISDNNYLTVGKNGQAFAKQKIAEMKDQYFKEFM